MPCLIGTQDSVLNTISDLGGVCARSLFQENRVRIDTLRPWWVLATLGLVSCGGLTGPRADDPPPSVGARSAALLAESIRIDTTNPPGDEAPSRRALGRVPACGRRRGARAPAARRRQSEGGTLGARTRGRGRRPAADPALAPRRRAGRPDRLDRRSLRRRRGRRLRGRPRRPRRQGRDGRARPRAGRAEAPRHPARPRCHPARDPGRRGGRNRRRRADRRAPPGSAGGSGLPADGGRRDPARRGRHTRRMGRGLHREDSVLGDALGERCARPRRRRAG